MAFKKFTTAESFTPVKKDEVKKPCRNCKRDGLCKCNAKS